MRRKKFEDKLYLYVRGELPKSEMREMKSEIERSAESRMLYEKMNSFLKDSKKLFKEIKVKQINASATVEEFRNKTEVRKNFSGRYFQKLAVAASLLLMFGLIFVLVKNTAPVFDKKDVQKKENLIIEKKEVNSNPKMESVPAQEKTKKKHFSRPSQEMTANLSPKLRNVLGNINPAPVKRIVYLTDDPKVKIYWITELN